MKHRLTPILLVSAFLIIGGIFVRTTLFTTFERTFAIVPHQPSVSNPAPNLRIAPPAFQPNARQDSPRPDSNQSAHPHSPR
ncbi:MAG: hypothetical protein AAF587_01425 [Bacteroidota bacterium]